jgi:predicted RNase H-like nuclease (RuvC/YqgF family)
MLRRQYKQLLKANKLLKKQNSKLSKSLTKLKNNQQALYKKISRMLSEEKTREILGFKEKRLNTLQSELGKKEQDAAELEEAIKKLNFLVAELKTGVLLKKLNNLGWEEFAAKNRILNLREEDILLVEEPNVYSQKTMSYLKDKVSIIVTKNKANKKTKEDIGMVFIDAEKLDIKENEYFAVADREQLEKEKNKINILAKIVEDYKGERNIKL